MYRVIFRDEAKKQLNKIDYSQRQIIVKWIRKHLANTTEPKAFGKPLNGDLKGYWRYRVGNYRVIADIRENEIIIFIVAVGHRGNIYKRLNL